MRRRHEGYDIGARRCARHPGSAFSIEDDMINAGAEWMHEEVLRDAHLLTSRKPDDRPACLRTIVEALDER